MALTDEKRKYLDEMLEGTGSIQETGRRVNESFEAMLDEMVSLIDAKFINQQKEQINMLGQKLETFLSQVKNGSTIVKKRKRWDFSSEKAPGLLSGMGSISGKIEEIMNGYKIAYRQLEDSVEMQITKGHKMVKQIEEFKDIEEYLTEKLLEIDQEGFEGRVLYSSACSFVKGLGKLIVDLEQKMVILEASIINSISLRSEMGAGQSHFSSLMKDILITSSIDSIITAGANIMNVFREIVEKHNVDSVKNTITTAEEVSKIRSNGIISIKSLQSTGVLIDQAGQKFKALGTQQVADNKRDLQAVKALGVGLNKKRLDNSGYLLTNDVHALRLNLDQDGKPNVNKVSTTKGKNEGA